MYDCDYRPDSREKLHLWSPILNDFIRLRNCDLARQRFELNTEKLELRTEVELHRLELDRARLELARQKASAGLNPEGVPALSPRVAEGCGALPWGAVPKRFFQP